jgi:hypothetical protein
VRREFRWRPTRAGEKAGLFGDALPGAEDPVWAKLPVMSHAHVCRSLKSFTEVLVEGEFVAGGLTRTFPLIVSRRFGRGAVVVVNAEGLWKWDFFPSYQQARAMYETFWTQLLQWTATYSAYLPGQDYALNVSRSSVDPGQPVRVEVTRRGEADTGPPGIRILRDSVEVQDITLSASAGVDGRWEAIAVLGEPGDYTVELTPSAGDAGRKLYEAVYVRFPLSETDALSADPGFLDELAEMSGGRSVREDELLGLLEAKPVLREVQAGEAEWEPSWANAWCLALLLVVPALEWFTRRRNGLM